jgi:hypothetical protein
MMTKSNCTQKFTKILTYRPKQRSDVSGYTDTIQVNEDEIEKGNALLSIYTNEIQAYNDAPKNKKQYPPSYHQHVKSFKVIYGNASVGSTQIRASGLPSRI